MNDRVIKLDYEHYWDQGSSHSNNPSVRLRNRFILDQLSKLEFNALLDIDCGDEFFKIQLTPKSGKLGTLIFIVTRRENK